MADIIRLLPDHVANQIAAGEVIQRPASAVKELLENAIDAKATHIKLIIKDAGKTLVQVIDNGIGMSVSDARLAFERHATSKIKKAEDLFSLHTKGFRGEALASIAAIAHIEMTTKRPSDELGTEIRIEGSKITHQEPCVTADGTSIAMKNLFFNIPARRNFLKSDAVEIRHIFDEFHRVALAHPSIHFQFYNNGSEVFNLPSANFRQRIVHLFGAKTNEKLVPIEEETPILKISGFVVKPAFVSKTKPLQFLLVNNRFVKSRYLNHAISAAYEGLILPNQQPEYFICLEVNPATIDINIHPTKTEIKFEDEHSIYALLKSAIKHSLGQFKITQSIDFELNTDFEVPYHYKDKAPTFPKIDIDPSFNPFKEEKSSQKPDYQQFSSKMNAHFSAPSLKKGASWESLYTELKNDTQLIENQVVTKSLFETETDVFSAEKIGWLGRKYLITTHNAELLIIHINRAHERILFEDFLKTLRASSTASQQLMFPIEISFSKAEIQAVISLKELLENIGFIIDFQADTVLVSGIPLSVSDGQVTEIFTQLVSDYQNEIPEKNDYAKELFAKNLAKSLAIKTGQFLSEEAQENLIKNLFSCKEILTSPFGKQICMRFDVFALDRFF